MKDQFIKKQIEEFDVELGKTFITGIQDGSYDEELEREIKDFFAHAVSQAYDEGFKYGNTRKINEIRIAKDYDFSCGEMAMLEKVDRIVPKKKDNIHNDGIIGKLPEDIMESVNQLIVSNWNRGWNANTSYLLTELKKLKEKI